MNGKLLIYYNQKTNSKASLMYDLKDCCIKGNCYENTIDDAESYSTTKLEESDSQNWKCLSTKIREKRSKASNTFTLAPEDDDYREEFKDPKDSNEDTLAPRSLIRHPSLRSLMKLHYEIEVNHPYLNKCILRSRESAGSYQFYSQMSQQAN